MRISDWSSDVCSSDLIAMMAAKGRGRPDQILGSAGRSGRDCDEADRGPSDTNGAVPSRDDARPDTNGDDRPGSVGDRKSVGSGKRESVRVDLGGSGVLKKKKKNTNITSKIVQN